MINRIFGFLFSVIMILSSSSVSQAEENREPRAVEVVNRAMEAMGGLDTWEGIRLISFKFVDRRTHFWDKQTGDIRQEWTQEDEGVQVNYVVSMNIYTMEGKAWANQRAVPSSELPALLEKVYAAWINDTYWLAMPWKFLDPGVNLAYEGTEEIEGTICDVVHLSFSDVGLTSGDQYWVYIDKESGMILRWGYILESYSEGASQTLWDWEEWEEFGGVKISQERVNTVSKRKLTLSNIKVMDEVPEKLFSSPADYIPGRNTVEK